MKGKRKFVDKIIRKVSSDVKFGDLTIPNVDLRYNSSIHHSAKTTPVLYDMSIPYLPLSDANSLDIALSMVITFEDENDFIRPDHYRSYYRHTFSMKPDLTVWWFNEEQILKLYKFENDKKTTSISSLCLK